MCHEESNHQKAHVGVRSAAPSNRRLSSSRGQTHSANHTTANTTTNAQRNTDENILDGIVLVSWPGLLPIPSVYEQHRNATHRNSWRAAVDASSIVAGWKKIPKRLDNVGATTTRNATRKTRPTSTIERSNGVHVVWLHPGNSPARMPRGFYSAFVAGASTVMRKHRPLITSHHSSEEVRIIPGTSVQRAATAMPRKVPCPHFNSSRHVSCVVLRNNTY